MKTKPRTAVLYGGNSVEREVSVLSGMAVAEALKSAGFDVASIDARGDFIGAFRESKAEVAFLALHGAFGEDGQIQLILDDAGIPYTGSGPEASRVGMDKTATKKILVENGIRTPQCHLAGPLDGDDLLHRAAEKLGYPTVVKPPCGGSSLGVSIARTVRELDAAVAWARQLESNVLLEKYVPGRELTVAVINGRALPVIEIICRGFYNFKAKYTKGHTEYVVEPRLAPAVEQAVKEAGAATYRCLGCAGAARVDLRLDEANAPWVLEINTIPGMTATSLLPKAARAVGIEFPQLCEMMIADALERRGAMQKSSANKRGAAVAKKRASA